MRRNRSRRQSEERQGPDLAREDSTPLDPFLQGLTSEPFPALDASVDDLIHTGLSDSGVPRPSHLRGVMRSPWAQARAQQRVQTFQRVYLREPYGPTPQLPQRALSCARRSIRREVLFALKRTSKGAGAKKRRRDFNSRHRC